MRHLGGCSPQVAPRAQVSTIAAASTDSTAAGSSDHSTVISSSFSLTGDGNDRFSIVDEAAMRFGMTTRFSSGVNSRVLRQFISRTMPVTPSRRPALRSTTKSSSR